MELQIEVNETKVKVLLDRRLDTNSPPKLEQADSLNAL